MRIWQGLSFRKFYLGFYYTVGFVLNSFDHMELNMVKYPVLPLIILSSVEWSKTCYYSSSPECCVVCPYQQSYLSLHLYLELEKNAFIINLCSYIFIYFCWIIALKEKLMLSMYIYIFVYKVSYYIVSIYISFGQYLYAQKVLFNFE